MPESHKMAEIFTTPREEEWRIVTHILNIHNIKHINREEEREYGWRYCVYIPENDVDFAYKIIDEGLSEEGF
jgi:hypothetical protein